ncbi:MAG: hypothetical protein ACRD3W_05595 [Terriglobales bacterium]
MLFAKNWLLVCIATMGVLWAVPALANDDVSVRLDRCKFKDVTARYEAQIEAEKRLLQATKKLVKELEAGGKYAEAETVRKGSEQMQSSFKRMRPSLINGPSGDFVGTESDPRV